MLSKLTFWTSLLFIFYTYAGYPILLFAWAKLFPKKINKSCPKEYPAVTVLIAAKNEENNIGPRMDNLLAQNYPKDKLEILIISDGSVDRTNKIILEYAETAKESKPPIKLLALASSKGKPSALNEGIKYAKGEIIVFADARQKFNSNVIEELVVNFTDPTVGCVSGELLFIKDSDSNIKEEMGLYWKIEKIVRKLESTIGSVAGATGAIYAIRKSLYKTLPEETLLDDVLTPMNIVFQGFRTIFESNACAYDTISKDARQEWRRKVRTLAGNWQFFNVMPSLFSPRENPIWWRFLSHKFFRLLVPFCLPLQLASAIMSDGTFYIVLTYLQLLFYMMAASGWLIPKTRSSRIINLSYFFIFLNFAALNGFVYWIRGNCNKTWGKN
ncbi:MAG: glycosyltransferase family 2 protein [Desulfobulbaceae bacterium]|nr:glycosyltransferase family 2 protein [Desulfobulbaceae bacterium]